MQKENCFTDRLKENKRVVIKNKCHSKLDLESHRFLKRQQGEILNQVQDDVFFYNNGFTLIELLVVVLIIGILAAVAVPQYRVAVIKARVATYLPLIKSIAEVQENYYMVNGTYARWGRETAALDVDMPKECTATIDGNTWKCGNDFLFDYSSTDLFALFYCPKYNSSYGPCSSHRVFVLARTYRFPAAGFVPESLSCKHATSLGRSVCKALRLN